MAEFDLLGRIIDVFDHLLDLLCCQLQQLIIFVLWFGIFHQFLVHELACIGAVLMTYLEQDGVFANPLYGLYKVIGEL